jgi:hypothetical protein
MEHPIAVTVSSLMQAPSYLRSGHLGGRSKTLVHHQACRGDATWADTQSLQRAIKLTGRMKGHALSTVHATLIAMGIVIENGAALALRA